MSRRVFLHVGTPKSGTTYLQDRWSRNRALLKEQGLYYPDTPTGDHFYAALDVIQREWGGELDRAAGQWDALAADAGRSKHDVLISHEILASARPAQVERVMRSFAGDEVHVVLTVRDLARQIPAEWQEQIKHRGTNSFARVLSLLRKARRTDSKLWFWRVHSVPDILSRWSAGMEPSRIHVVTVPPAGAPRDLLWQRMCQVLGLDADRDYADAELLNASLGMAETNVIRRLNLRLAEKGVHRGTYVELVRQLIVRDVLATRESAVPAQLPASMASFVDEVTDEWREWLDGSGVEIVGERSDLDPIHPDGKVPNPDRPPMRDVADAALDALAAVIAEAERAGATTDPDRTLARIARRLFRP